MIAAVRENYGSPKDIKVKSALMPIPKAKEVLVQIHATTINRTDCANLTAKPFIMRFVLGLFKPRISILGTDFSGEIVAIGKNITSFKVGEKVFGFKDTGIASHAEYMAVEEKELYIMPEKCNFKQAAASLEGAHYAYSFLHKVQVKPQQKILIHGATGAIGSALLQFVNPLDVEITASCTAEYTELIRSLGAEKIYDYTKTDFTLEEEEYDFIFDAVGKSSFTKCKPILKDKGIYISSELGAYAQNIFYALISPFLNKKVVFPVPLDTKKTIPYIFEAIKNGVFMPVIDDSEYSLEDISKGFTYVLKGNKTGNVILNIKD